LTNLSIIHQKDAKPTQPKVSRFKEMVKTKLKRSSRHAKAEIRSLRSRAKERAKVGLDEGVGHTRINWLIASTLALSMVGTSVNLYINRSMKDVAKKTQAVENIKILEEIKKDTKK
jgi:hypothetical protein